MRSDNYTYHQFYTSDKMGLKKKKAILTDALSKSYNHWVDELDCTISYSRRKIDIPFDEVLKLLDKKSHFVIIHRRGFTPNNQEDVNDFHRWYLEIGFSTMTPVSYYLWIHCEQSLLPYFIKKYKLKVKD